MSEKRVTRCDRAQALRSVSLASVLNPCQTALTVIYVSSDSLNTSFNHASTVAPRKSQMSMLQARRADDAPMLWLWASTSRMPSNFV